MKTRESLETLIEIAGRWAENAEECGLERRIEASDSDEECARLAGDTELDAEDVIAIRDVWRAIDTASMLISQRGCEQLDPAVTDGRFTTFADIVVFG